MTVVVAALFVAAIGAGLVSIGREVEAVRLADVLERWRNGAPPRLDQVTGAPMPAAGNPRARFFDAFLRVRAARALPPGPVRDGLAATARRELDAVLAGRRWFAEGWMVAAYVDAADRDPAGRRRSLAALVRSYADAPYLRESGQWRVATALGWWPLLDPATRRRAVDEAIWLGRIDVESYDALAALIRGTPAYRPFMSGYAEARGQDEDQARF